METFKLTAFIKKIPVKTVINNVGSVERMLIAFVKVENIENIKRIT